MTEPSVIRMGFIRNEESLHLVLRHCSQSGEGKAMNQNFYQMLQERHWHIIYNGGTNYEETHMMF